MKKVFSNLQCCHVWAQQTQSEGRSSHSGIFFEGPAIYSYGRHFKMAEFIKKDVVLINRNHYSMTTSRHQNDMRSALNGLPIITIRVPDPSADPVAVRDNARIMINKIDESILSIDQSKSHADYGIENLAKEVAELDTYLFHCKGITKKQLARLNQLKKIIDNKKETSWPKKIKEQEEKARYRREHEEEVRAERQRLHNIKCQDNLVEWLKGGRFQSYDLPHDVTYLRVKGNHVQTSRGAEVDLWEGKQLLAAWKAGVIQVGMACGHFTVREVTPDLLTIGCHELTREQIERVAPDIEAAKIKREFEVHACRIISKDEDGTEHMEQCGRYANDIACWTVYEHFYGKGVEALEDFKTEGEADEYMAKLEMAEMGVVSEAATV
jgi:hypothetical protein